MQVAILTKPENKSPKILAISLQNSLKEAGYPSKIFYALDTVRRLVPLRSKPKFYARRHFRFRQKLWFYFKDLFVLSRLRKYDFIIISECIPNAFWKNYYAIPELKEKIKVPIGLYEVYFLDSATHYIDYLKQSNDNLQNTYDFHLAVSEVSYTKTIPNQEKFQIGLNLNSFKLAPSTKAEFFALIDFPLPGGENERKIQLEVLRKLKIPYIELIGSYEIEEIRLYYKNAAIYFIQHFESFGLPIAECLSYGTAIFTANNGWPMAFRLDDEPELFGSGILADCFYTYNDQFELEKQISQFRDSFDPKNTPQKIFHSFLKNYPSFYYGNRAEMDRFSKFINK